MMEFGIDVYYIPMSDCHNSEYVADHFRCIEFMSGFTGSAGSLVVTADEAWLFADGRYYIQAARQLEGTGIQLMKMGQPDVPELEDFLREKSEGRTLGFDGSVVCAETGRRLESRPGKGLVPDGPARNIIYDRDLVGEYIWTDRPAQAFSDIFELPQEFTGETAESKINRIRKKLETCVPAGEDYLYIINSLDDIAWIFNLRADDIPCNPVQFAYAAITRNCVKLFTGSKAPEGCYESGAYSSDCLCGGVMERTFKTVLMDVTRISYDTYKYYDKPGIRIIDIKNPSTMMKAVKNETEIKCLKEALLRDSAVMINFMYWLKNNIGKMPMDEVSAADHLQHMRMSQEKYLELSFGTISAYKENAAQMHYNPDKTEPAKLEPEGFLLVDSGCQYLDGTTDITRTFVLGPLTDEEKKAFTLTAVSMLRLMNAKFLKGCTGENLDIMAREPMWKAGWDYKCGTGHGIGHVLNVHEGPHRIRWKINPDAPVVMLEPGMVVTDEPGVYREGKYGVRTENELLVVPYLETEDGTFYQFENLTFIPIDLDAVDKSYLSEEDVCMLNEYHKKIFELMESRVDAEVRDWLKYYTRAI